MKTLTNFTQIIALSWLKQIDRSLIIFNMLKDYGALARGIFYLSLISFTVGAMVFIKSFAQIVDTPDIFILLGSTIFYAVIIGMSLVITLESVYKLDVKNIFEAEKQKEIDAKKNKLQFWRLRNMNIFLRIFIYILLYMFMLLIIQMSAQGAFIHLFATAPDTQETKAQIAFFMNEYDIFLKWFTFIFIISFLTLDYFVSKKRAAKKVVEV